MVVPHGRLLLENSLFFWKISCLLLYILSVLFKENKQKQKHYSYVSSGGYQKSEKYFALQWGKIAALFYSGTYHAFK